MVEDVPRVLVCGATGRTGSAIVAGLLTRSDVHVVGGVAPSFADAAGGSLPGGAAGWSSIADVDVPYSVLLDVSVAEAAEQHLTAALEAGAHAVIGTTGLRDGVLESFDEPFAARSLGLLHAPNFAIGAVLMMRWAAEMAHWFDDLHIVETHHVAKRDTPSGTAIRTASVMADARGTSETADIPIHSLRMEGAVAHQDVIGSNPGERLTITHDALDRSCYAHGVTRAAIGVTGLRGLHIGLEHVL